MTSIFPPNLIRLIGINNSRSYDSVLSSDAIERYCARLIDVVAATSASIGDDGERMMDDDEDDDDDEEANDDEIERRLIDEFGSCLAEIISSAEKRKLAANYS